jgi:tRNA (guanine-N7-)-methyltransferase
MAGRKRIGLPHPPGGWPETRYEAKARRHDHEVWYFRYVRI